MKYLVRQYEAKDLPELIAIWNSVIEDGETFPQLELLNAQSGAEHFAAQTYTGVAADAQTGKVMGLYILHPNNVGRCGLIANAGYMVKRGQRGAHIGDLLVKDSVKKAGELGFRILQFNAVVKTNTHAVHLYERNGFTQVGVIPGGYLLKNGAYEDIIIFFRNV